MGINKMLKQGLGMETAALKSPSKKEETEISSSTIVPPADPEPVHQTISSDSSEDKKKKSTKDKIKRCGRPTNKEAGVESRKQYTLTLKEADYRKYLAIARSKNCSFAKFMEEAANEYIKKHNLIK